MPDFSDPADFKKLVSAVEWSEKKLAEFRADRFEALQEYVGYHYGENGTDDKRPINAVQIGTTVYRRKLRIKNPRGLVTTRYDELAGSADDYQLALNQVLLDMGLDEPINDAGLDAMFLFGMIEVGLDDSTDEVFCEDISADDAIIDMSGKGRRRPKFVGHRYAADLEWVKNNPEFNVARTEAQAMEASTGVDGESKESNPQTIAIGQGRVEEYKAQVELIQLFMVDERIVITYLADNPTAPLKERPWNGPPKSLWGPYRWVAFMPVPGNVMPIAPVQSWRDVNESMNVIAVKTLRQGERQKTITLIQNDADDDGQRMVDAADGDALGVSCDPDKVGEKRFGGADQINLGAVMWLKQLYMGDVSGGVGVLSGTSAATDTVGQDAMLLQSAGSQVEDMQGVMLEFTRDIIADIAWWIWTDPIGSISISRPVPGLSRRITYDWDAKRRAGEFIQYNFDVEPYSIAPATPQQRLNKVLSLWERVILPSIQYSGGAVQADYEALMKLIAEYSDTPELSRLLLYPSGEQHPEQPSPGRASRVSGSKGGKPNGKYTRTNRTSPQRVEADMMSKLLAGGPSREQAY